MHGLMATIGDIVGFYDNNMQHCSGQVVEVDNERSVRITVGITEHLEGDVVWRDVTRVDVIRHMPCCEFRVNNFVTSRAFPNMGMHATVNVVSR